MGNQNSVILKELTYEDLRVINIWRNDPKLTSLLGANFRFINIETDEQWFKNYLLSRDTQVRCGIHLKNDELIGVIYLTDIDYLNQSATISIMIGNYAELGKGYGYAAMIQMIEHGFKNLNLNRIELKVLSTNDRAYRLYEKCGFKQEGVLRQTMYKNGVFVDQIIMSLLKSEYGKTTGQ